MSKAISGSLRILFDMQAAQTRDSAKRGVGRYSRALFEKIASTESSHEVFMLKSAHLTHDYNTEILSPARILETPPMPEWSSKRSYAGGDEDALDGIAISALAQSIKPDVIHLSHVFEGFSEPMGLFDPIQSTGGQVVSATLYDSIPLLFQDDYLRNSVTRHWYYSRLAWLRKADLLLAISEHTRQDAIRLLGIEPWRIKTIHGGISDHFRPPKDKKQARRRLLKAFPLREKMVLYTGGVDFRKNIKGAIRAFAQVDKKLRENTQLVIVCSMQPQRKDMYLDVARKSGLGEEDILFTGFVEEKDLIDFYGACDVFVFPSLYEGLGLPVLEAMACGAPVIGGNNSSVRELIVRKDALFDAANDNSIAESISKVLKDKNFASDLRSHGLKRAAEFTWQRTAGLALEAFEEAISRKHSSGIQCAVNGWLPRRRLAVLSPLPPCRSGIADYNAQFLPFLARHFEIDLYVDGYVVDDGALSSAFRIFDVKDFEGVAASYDLILYEFGNSNFHAHMLPLLKKFPGVVGLHDAYLCALFGYMDFNTGDAGVFEWEMLAAHGPYARHYFAPIQANSDPIKSAIADLPCTKGVLDMALGVISHSVFNLEVARAFYPEGWLAPYRIIPQMVLLPGQTRAAERSAIRAELGFGADDFIITTFGHIGWIKWGDRLLEAFLQSSARKNPKVHLIFAGGLADVALGERLKQSIQKSGLKDRIRITGYLSMEDYVKYVKIADLGVQLRTKSRGGTPKGVLDCLSHGTPVMVNNDASYRDYPDDVVIKVEADPTVASIAEKIDSFFTHQEQLAAYAMRGLKYLAENHDPAKCAAAYAVALNEFAAREKASHTDSWVEALAPIIGNSPDHAENAKQAANWLASIPRPSFNRTLYIDVSYIASGDLETGIQRVVKQIVSKLYTGKFTGFNTVAVELVEGELREAKPWLNKKGLLSPCEGSDKSSSSIEFTRGDILLMLDSSWAPYSEFYPFFDEAREAHAPVITVVYDLLPITLPPAYTAEDGPGGFEVWLRKAIESSDALVCISRATADEVIGYIEKNMPEKKELKVGYWHLGADLEKSKAEGKTSERVQKVIQKPYLLVVGTIEPRKSHALILDSMELLWKQGIELNLCIAGKEGWKSEDLVERLRSHPELGKRLFFIEKPDDKEIIDLYKNASGLIFLSLGEGFGLPIVEAAHYGVPVICSDLPVFREVAGEYATYVKIDTAEKVSRDILKWWDKSKSKTLPDITNMPLLTWEESAKQLLKVVFENNWYWRK